MDAKLTWQRDGVGIGWAAGGVTASPVIGILIEPFRRTIGLENVTIVYLATVVPTAAFGGRAAGLSYDFFLLPSDAQPLGDELPHWVSEALVQLYGEHGFRRLSCAT